MMYQYTCQDCGATAETGSYQSAMRRKYCPECAKERHKHIVNRRRKEGGLMFTCQVCGQAFPLAEGQTTQRQYCDKCKDKIRHKPKSTPATRKRKSTIETTLAEAKAAGMSYGRYRAMVAEQARIAAKRTG